ncbi:hypothetical protein ACVRWN_03860, partial [Streptococcus sinensis]
MEKEDESCSNEAFESQKRTLRLMKMRDLALQKTISYLTKSYYNIKKSEILNRTPKVRQKKSNIWGVIFMKLSYEDKVKIYELRQNGESIKSLSDQFSVAESGIQYMIRLIDRYGMNIVKKGKNTYYSPELKQEMIDKVLLKQQSKLTVSLDYALPNRGTLPNWIA